MKPEDRDMELPTAEKLRSGGFLVGPLSAVSVSQPNGHNARPTAPCVGVGEEDLERPYLVNGRTDQSILGPRQQLFKHDTSIRHMAQ